MKTTFIILILILSISLKASNYVRVNTEINLNICNKYPNNKEFIWEVLQKPSGSILINNDINSNKCNTSFIPRKKGEYKIQVKTDNDKEVFLYYVLNNLKKSKLEIKYILNNKYYYNILEYYKDADNNNLTFSLNKKIRKINFNINGVAVVEDLMINKTYLINTNKDNYLKYDNLYKITFYPDKYKKLQLISKIDDIDINNLNFEPTTKKIKINIVNFKNKRIFGSITLYNIDNNIIKLVSNNLFLDNVTKLIFSPIKYINNYPSIVINKKINSDINLRYDNIKFVPLKIQLKNIIGREYLTIKLVSLFLNKCLVLNNENINCLYQRTVNINGINENKEILIPEGKYEVTIYRKGYNNINKIIDLNNESILSVKGFQKKKLIEIILPKNLTSIAFNSLENNDNYFFNIKKDSKSIEIAKGFYDITLFTLFGIYHMKSINLSNDNQLVYNWSKINIILKDAGKTKYGGVFIISNKNIVYNNGYFHEFYIKK